MFGCLDIWTFESHNCFSLRNTINDDWSLYSRTVLYPKNIMYQDIIYNIRMSWFVSSHHPTELKKYTITRGEPLT